MGVAASSFDGQGCPPVNRRGRARSLWGKLFTGVPADEAQHIEVERLETVQQLRPTGRNNSRGLPSLRAREASASYPTFLPVSILRRVSRTAMRGSEASFSSR